MKNKILIISKEYIPTFNGSVACLSNLLNCLNEYYDINVVCFKDQAHSQDTENINGYRVNRFIHWTDLAMRYREKVISKKKNLKLQHNLMKLSKPFFILNYCISKKYGLRYDGWATKGFKMIDKNLNLSEYDFILTLGAPFENLDLALRISETYNIPFYVFQLDLYSFNPVYLKKKGIQNRLQKEKKWYDNASHIFVTSEMYPIIMNSELNNYKHKITAIQMPNLVKPINSSYQINKHGDINIAYTGMFYEDIRNPKEMFEIFSKIFLKIPNIKLHIVGHGCEEIIFKYMKLWPENIIFYGKREQSFVKKIVMNADILLNLSNSIVSQAPSKIIEYISTGKPIINVYFLDQDKCVEILKRYPLATNIKVGTESERISDFILRNINQSIDFAEISQKFSEYTPEYVAKKMFQIMMR